MKRLVLLFIVVALTACEKDLTELEELGENAGIVGTWIDDGQRGDTLWLKRAGELDKLRYGFTIEEDGTFIERKNVEWCATSSVTLDNYEGTWEAVSDSLLDITVGYWGGMMTYQIRIISVDEKDLAIQYLYSNDREKNR